MSMLPCTCECCRRWAAMMEKQIPQSPTPAASGLDSLGLMKVPDGKDYAPNVDSLLDDLSNIRIGCVANGEYERVNNFIVKALAAQPAPVVTDAVPNDDDTLAVRKMLHKYGVFIYEVDFGDEGKGRYVRLNDFTRTVEKLEAQPAPGVGGVRECRECGSRDVEWDVSYRNTSQVVEGRLRTHDVKCVFVLGCNTCSETLEVIDAEQAVTTLSTRPAESVAQGGEVLDGFVLVPRKMHVDADAWESASFSFGGPATGEGEAYMDCTLWVGDIDLDDGGQLHGLHVSCNECPEEGSITLAEFPATPTPATGSGGEES